MILSQIEHYWTGRAEGYSQVNQHELSTGQDQVWFQEISRYLPEGKTLKILDVGTGPGFFAILLAREGYDVTAVIIRKPCWKRRERMRALWQKRYISAGWMPSI